jgi:RNA polymerase sigma-70 factor (ECF subfamily)
MDNRLSDSSDLRDSGLQHLDALYGYAFTLTRQKTEAEDLVQETYLRAVRNRHQFVPGSNLKAWLFVIMRNAWLNQVRHERNGPRFLDLEAPDSLLAQADRRVLNNPHVIYMQKVERHQVRSAIDSLPAAYREIVILRDIEGFSYQEIATMLACPAGTVMSRLGRARERLRQILTSESRTRARGV